jgi:hypothetical protein
MKREGLPGLVFFLRKFCDTLRLSHLVGLLFQWSAVLGGGDGDFCRGGKFVSRTRHVGGSVDLVLLVES